MTEIEKAFLEALKQIEGLSEEELAKRLKEYRMELKPCDLMTAANTIQMLHETGFMNDVEDDLDLMLYGPDGVETIELDEDELEVFDGEC